MRVQGSIPANSFTAHVAYILKWSVYLCVVKILALDYRNWVCMPHMCHRIWLGLNPGPVKYCIFRYTLYQLSYLTHLRNILRKQSTVKLTFNILEELKESMWEIYSSILWVGQIAQLVKCSTWLAFVKGSWVQSQPIPLPHTGHLYSLSMAYSNTRKVCGKFIPAFCEWVR